MKKQTKQILIFVTIFTAWIITVTALLIVLPKRQSKEINSLSEIKEQEVKLSGAVNFPGYYTISENESLSTLINYANGFSENADSSKVEITRRIKENEKEIFIPYKKTDKLSNYKINLNKANYDMLKASQVLSENRIIEILIYRREHEGFKSLDELKNVKGIGDATFNKIKEYFTI